MLKSCKYCGKIHDYNYICPSKPTKKNYKSNIKLDRFRTSKTWIYKRDSIRDRDKHLCQICIRKTYNTFGRQYNHNNIQIHHIVPLVEDYDKRLDDYNLITLCTYHHDMAEKGIIPKQELIDIVKEQEKQYSNL